MRVFFAVELDDEIRACLVQLVEEMRPKLRGARWVPVDNIHLTLRFLGETSAETARSLSARLESVLAETPPFTLELAGLGAFPNARRPRTLWVGVSSPPAALYAVQEKIERAARDEGFASEKKSFSPHLTLARFKRPDRGVGSIVESELGEREIGELQVGEIACLESELGPDRARYRALSRLPLGASSSGQGRERLL